MHACSSPRPLLQSFVDGELDDVQRQWVAAHLEASRRCGLAASTYETLKRRLNGIGQPADPDAVASLTEFVDRLAHESDDSGSGGKVGQVLVHRYRPVIVYSKGHR